MKICLVVKLYVYLKHFSDEFIFIILVCNGPLGMTVKTASMLLQNLLLHYIGILLTFNFSDFYIYRVNFSCSIVVAFSHQCIFSILVLNKF